MSEPLIVQTLKQKRAEIFGQIKAYEAQIAHAKHDLAHVNATIELFAALERQRARYIVSHGFFKKGEITEICVQHLGDGTEMTTRELAEQVMIERDLEITDTALRNSVVFKVVQALRHAKRRKLVRMVEKRQGMCVWAAVSIPEEKGAIRRSERGPAFPGPIGPGNAGPSRFSEGQFLAFLLWRRR